MRKDREKKIEKGKGTGKDKYKALRIFTAFTFAVAGIGSVVQAASSDDIPVTQTYYPEQSVLPPADNDPTTVALITPEVRGTAQAENANAVATLGIEGLVKEKFPVELIDSQRSINDDYKIFYTFNDKEYYYDMKENAEKYGSTLISLDETDFKDFILIGTAGHVYDVDTRISNFEEYVKRQMGPGNVVFERIEQTKIRVGNDLVLNEGEFGAVHSYISDSVNFTDFGFIIVPKVNISPEILEKMMKDAIPVSNILFDKTEPGDKYDIICKPAAIGYRDIITVDADFVGDYGRGALIKPSVISGGCSGSGVGVVDTNGKFYLAGITAATIDKISGYGDVAVIQPYSGIGRDAFLNAIESAKYDLDLRASLEPKK